MEPGKRIFIIQSSSLADLLEMEAWKDKFYGSRKWKSLRKAVRSRDKGLCQECLKKGIVRQGDAVHHIVALNESNVDDETISLNADNLITLCTDCHAAKHRTERRYTIDELGRVIVNE